MHHGLLQTPTLDHYGALAATKARRHEEDILIVAACDL
jgi:hypothetical protein